MSRYFTGTPAPARRSGRRRAAGSRPRSRRAWREPPGGCPAGSCSSGHGPDVGGGDEPGCGPWRSRRRSTPRSRRRAVPSMQPHRRGVRQPSGTSPVARGGRWSRSRPHGASGRVRTARCRCLVRRRAGSGPYGGERPALRGRHGCASADENRAPCVDGDCSAGTCAWSSDRGAPVDMRAARRTEPWGNSGPPTRRVGLSTKC
jgi:hypothetical protein